MKKNKSKGFTLIELMVVISIIALLSSIVLASIRTARQRADNTKIVSEMKSLQTALELYKARFGIYPNVEFDEDEACTYNCFQGWNSFVKTYLVDNKFISKIPQSKNYPNNCVNGDCGNGNMFNYFGSSFLYTGDPNYYYMCGGKKISGDYVLAYVTKEKLNLPKFTFYNAGSVSGALTGGSATTTYDHCLSI